VIKGGLQRGLPCLQVALALAFDDHSGLGRWVERKRQAISGSSRLHQELRCDPNSKEALKLLAGAPHF